MLILDQLLASGADCDDRVELPFDARQKARQRVTLASGRDAGLKLPRGTILRGGDRLGSTCGVRVRVDAAPETLSRAVTGDPLMLARAAYHLGNRHVRVQVGDGWLGYLHDHVLDGMVAALGLAVSTIVAPFEPEAGAYGHAGHSHADGTAHAHEPDDGAAGATGPHHGPAHGHSH